MSIMSRVFSSKPKPESMAVQQQAANPAVIANQPTEQSANGPAIPILPLDNFKDVWDTPTVDKNAPPDPFASPLLTVDPAAIADRVSKMDFMSGLPADLLTKATTGDTAAFGQVVNTAIQKALAAQIQLSGQIVENAVTKNNDRVNSTLSKRIREVNTNEIRSSNPVLQHPAAAPMLDTLKRQLLSKDPNATPTQIQERAEEMLITFGSALSDNKQQQERPKGKDPSDFSSW